MNFIIVSPPNAGQGALHFQDFTPSPFRLNLITPLIVVGGGVAETGNNLLNSLVCVPALNIYVQNNGQMWMPSIWQASNAALPDTSVNFWDPWDVPFHLTIPEVGDSLALIPLFTFPLFSPPSKVPALFSVSLLFVVSPYWLGTREMTQTWLPSLMSTWLIEICYILTTPNRENAGCSIVPVSSHCLF